MKHLPKLILLMFALTGSLHAQVNPSVLCHGDTYLNGDYTPDINHLDHTPIKTIRVNVHYFLKPDGTGNFRATDDGMGNTGYTGYSYANDLINLANQTLENLSPSLHPPGNTIPNIGDSRIRYSLDGVYFHNVSSSEYQYNLSCDNAVTSRLINESYVVNIFCIENDPSSVISGGVAFLGCASGPFIKLSDVWSLYHLDNKQAWYVQRTLNHEMGHILGLGHAWSSNDDLLFGYDCADTQHHAAAWQGVSNNIMSYVADMSALTPCQIGLIHQRIMRSLVPYMVPDFCSYNPSKTITIHSGEHIVWNSSRYLLGDVVIESGASLTVACEIGFPSQAKLVVQRGGKLVLDGGRLTNVCGEMWAGVELWGTYNQSQIPILNNPHQGLVVMMNQAVIENARDGIRTLRTGSDGSIDYSYTGGIIRANNSSFINCRRGVEFMAYHNPSGGNNVSYFTQCNFLTTGPLNGGGNPMAFVTMWEVDGIRFYSNNFINSVQGTESYKGVGIGTIDARFMVVPYWKTMTTGNYFEGLNYAIHAVSANRLNTATISQSVFVDNQRSILLSGMDYPEVTENDFETGWRDNLPPYGLYLQDCSGFHVEGNTFTCYHSNAPYGIIVRDSKLKGNEIYRNTINAMKGGFLGRGDNLGLEAICNNFTNNTIDIGSYEDGLARDQGFCYGTVYDPARNQFSNNGWDAGGSITHTAGTPLLYHYYGSGSYDPLYLAGLVSKLSCTNGSNTCANYSDPFTTMGPPFTNEMNNLNAARLGKNNTDDDPDLFNKYLSDYHNAYDAVTRRLLTRLDTIIDSTYILDPDITGLVTFMENERSTEGIINPALFYAYLKNGQITDANDLLDDYEIQLGGEYTNEFILMKAMLNVELSGSTYHNIDASVESDVRAVADNEGERGYGGAQALLALNFGETFSELVEPIPDVEEGELKLGEIRHFREPELLTSPNPFSEQLKISTFLPDTYKNGTIKITDARGRVVRSFSIAPGEQIHNVSFDDLNTGIYMIVLQSDSEVITSARVNHIK